MIRQQPTKQSKVGQILDWTIDHAGITSLAAACAIAIHLGIEGTRLKDVHWALIDGASKSSLMGLFTYLALDYAQKFKHPRMRNAWKHITNWQDVFSFDRTEKEKELEALLRSYDKRTAEWQEAAVDLALLKKDYASAFGIYLDGMDRLDQDYAKGVLAFSASLGYPLRLLRHTVKKALTKDPLQRSLYDAVLAIRQGDFDGIERRLQAAIQAAESQPKTRSYLKLRAKKGQSFLAENPLLVPVPLHYRRENWRGFNQARVLAERLGRAYQMAWAEPIVRTGYRDPQADIEDRNQRIENARGLYACVQPVLAQDRHIILIDDVCTTGATLNECARVLKAAGAKHVSALVLARG